MKKLITLSLWAALVVASPSVHAQSHAMPAQNVVALVGPSWARPSHNILVIAPARKAPVWVEPSCERDRQAALNMYKFWDNTAVPVIPRTSHVVALKAKN